VFVLVCVAALSLRTYQQPVFVYLPPNGRLQGGAWVVVDSTINEQYMEMYSDDDTRGGVLEPEGTVEVKFRHEEVLATAHRYVCICSVLCLCLCLCCVVLFGADLWGEMFGL
jgi:hypothetical protein